MSSWKPALLRLKPFDKSFDRDIQVESRTGSGRYTVNLYSYTCTCPDFVQRRADRPLGDIGRSCKHLRDEVLSLDTDAFGDELTRVIFKSPHGPYDRIFFAPGPDEEILAVGMTDGKPWINIFVRSGPDQPYGGTDIIQRTEGGLMIPRRPVRTSSSGCWPLFPAFEMLGEAVSRFQ